MTPGNVNRSAGPVPSGRAEGGASVRDLSAVVFLRDARRRDLRRRLNKYWMLYLFFAVPGGLLLVFHYIPIYGIQIAFKDFRIGIGIWGSQWNNFEHFKDFFGTPYFGRLMRNTLIISLQRLVFGFPAPVLLALLLNEVGSLRFKRVIQSISYLPHFMSWVVLAAIITEVLSPQRGIVAYFYTLFGKQPPNLLMEVRLFRPILIVTGIWQGVGWGTVVYLAAISSIDLELYESASIDGADRFQRAVHITIPALYPIITILFILQIGRILNAGFDQIFNLYNPIVYEVADVIDTYAYRVGLVQRRYDFSTAVGLFKNVFGVALLLLTNAVVKRFSEHGIW